MYPDFQNLLVFSENALKGVQSEVVIRSTDRILKNKFLTQLNISYSGINFKTFSILSFIITSVSIVHSFGEGRVQVSTGAFWDLFQILF